MRTCDIDGCNNKHRAKGLCATHYNQKLPNRHPKIIKTCDQCGLDCVKEQRASRYQGVYCSQLCRDYALFGPTSCKIPTDHWIYMFGKTSKWAPPLLNKSCAWCGTVFKPARDTARFCQHRCLAKFKRAKRRGAEHGAVGTYSWAELARLWAKFGRACAYCEKPTPLADIQAEHVVPLSRHGANNLTNLLPSCAPCNSDKRDLLLPDWATDRAARGKPPVRTTWATNDPLFSHLTSTTSSRLIAA